MPADADLRQRILDFIEFERLDDGNDEFHGWLPIALKRKRRIKPRPWRAETSRKCKHGYGDQELCHLRGC